MKLEEAKVILKENGYELLEEGKFARALAAGALALGNLFGAIPKNIIDFNTDSTVVEINQDELDSRIGMEMRIDHDEPNKLYYDTEKDNWYNCDFNTKYPSCKIYHKFNKSVYSSTAYYNKNGDIQLIEFNDEDNYGILHQIEYKNGKFSKEKKYYDDKGKELRTVVDYIKLTGIEYYPTGEIKCEFKIDKDGYKNGVLKMYYKNGKYAGSSQYEHGEFVGTTKCVDGRRGGEGLNCQIPLEK